MRLITLILTIGGLILAVDSGIAQASGLPDVEQKKIEALISGIERMTGAEFIRNGMRYNSAAAAEFLRRKWKARLSEIYSAADFIDKVASLSSTTGIPYRIRFGGGRDQLTAEYFRAQLSLLEGRSVKPAG
jgi:hypothetical protein